MRILVKYYRDLRGFSRKFFAERIYPETQNSRQLLDGYL